MDTEQILKEIRYKWQKQIDADSLVREVRAKIKAKKATYADAESLAVRAGRILSDLFREYLPDAAIDGRLLRETADTLIRRPLMDNYHLIAEEAEQLQKALNEAAGIGIKAVIPDANNDQIDGIIRGISSAQTYKHYEESFLDQVENFGEGVVDDFVRENADFQYRTGLSPTIERRAMSKCCAWCDRLLGTYQYEDVSDRGNDVFRRHKNCHCQILFNPGDGSKRRQNVHTRKWTNDSRSDRIAFAKRATSGNGFNTTADPMRDAFGPGETSHPKEILRFREEAREAGVEIVERTAETLAYTPGIAPGQPGRLYISEGASYSAWSHEIQHMRDDRDAGWSGFRILEDTNECFRREKRAYDVEIKLAEASGREDIADKLKDNLESERRHIYGLD